MRVDVAYKPIAGVRSFRLFMTADGPRLAGTVTRYVYDGPVSHQDTAPPARLAGTDGDAEHSMAYRVWRDPGFFAFPEDGLNPGYVGGFFPVVAKVSLFGTVVRHKAGARGQVMRIDRLWVAQGRWGQPKAITTYGEPFNEGLGIPPQAASVYFEWPTMLKTLMVPEASGGPLGDALVADLGAAYGCDAELVAAPMSAPRVLEHLGFKLCPQDEWKRPVHRVALVDIPQAAKEA